MSAAAGGGKRDPKELRVARALLRWFDPAARPMPWRQTRDPYGIWVSEIMLQQTTPAVVAPYYGKFLRAFPTVFDLARASQDEVLKGWEGLGYYARARNLHAAARRVVSALGGRLPETVEELMALPGIGRSTAGAIAAIAFGKDAPILDANAARVIGRVFFAGDGQKGAAGRRRMWEVSGRLVLPGKGRQTALALMDFGALVCTPRNPACSACPLGRYCLARPPTARGAGGNGRGGRPKPHADVAVVIVEDRGGRLLVGKRDEAGLFGGLWAFPGTRVAPGEAPAAAAGRAAKKAGIEVDMVAPLCVVPRAYSHYRVTLHAFWCRRAGGRVAPGSQWRFERRSRLETYPLIPANRRLLAFLPPPGCREGGGSGFLEGAEISHTGGRCKKKERGRKR